MRLGVRAALAGGAELAGDVDVEDGRVAAIGLSPAAAGGLAVPGFVDLQVNGYAGVDFLTAEPAGYAAAGAALAAAGVTAFQPTVISARPRRCASRSSALPPQPMRARSGCSASTSRARSCRRAGAARIRPNTCASPTRGWPRSSWPRDRSPP